MGVTNVTNPIFMFTAKDKEVPNFVFDPKKQYYTYESYHKHDDRPIWGSSNSSKDNGNLDSEEQHGQHSEEKYESSEKLDEHKPQNTPEIIQLNKNISGNQQGSTNESPNSITVDTSSELEDNNPVPDSPNSIQDDSINRVNLQTAIVTDPEIPNRISNASISDSNEKVENSNEENKTQDEVENVKVENSNKENKTQDEVENVTQSNAESTTQVVSKVETTTQAVTPNTMEIRVESVKTEISVSRGSESVVTSAPAQLIPETTEESSFENLTLPLISTAVTGNTTSSRKQDEVLPLSSSTERSDETSSADRVLGRGDEALTGTVTTVVGLKE